MREKKIIKKYLYLNPLSDEVDLLNFIFLKKRKKSFRMFLRRKKFKKFFFSHFNLNLYNYNSRLIFKKLSTKRFKRTSYLFKFNSKKLNKFKNLKKYFFFKKISQKFLKKKNKNLIKNLKQILIKKKYHLKKKNYYYFKNIKFYLNFQKFINWNNKKPVLLKKNWQNSFKNFKILRMYKALFNFKFINKKNWFNKFNYIFYKKRYFLNSFNNIIDKKKIFNKNFNFFKIKYFFLKFFTFLNVFFKKQTQFSDLFINSRVNDYYFLNNNFKFKTNNNLINSKKFFYITYFKQFTKNYLLNLKNYRNNNFFFYPFFFIKHRIIWKNKNFKNIYFNSFFNNKKKIKFNSFGNNRRSKRFYNLLSNLSSKNSFFNFKNNKKLVKNNFLNFFSFKKFYVLKKIRKNFFNRLNFLSFFKFFFLKRKFVIKSFYLLKNLEFILSNFISFFFKIDSRIFFLNVLKALSPHAIFQRLIMYRKFLSDNGNRLKLNKKIVNSFNYNFFNLYFYSIYFKNLILFLNFLNIHFNSVKDQRFIVKLLREVIKRTFLNHLNRNITGLKFLLTGKLTKRPRSRSTIILYRKVSGNQTLDTKIYYASRQLFNTFGAFGAKIWLYTI